MPTGEQILEQGKSTVANAVKSTVSDISGSVSSQVGLKSEPIVQNQSQTALQDQVNQGESAQIQTQRTKEMVEDFYSPSDTTISANQQANAQAEEQQLAAVRQKLYQELHNEVYYNPLFAYEHNLNKTESKAEELERQKQQEMQALEQKEADKPPPLAVTRAQTHTEANPGVAG